LALRAGTALLVPVALAGPAAAQTSEWIGGTGVYEAGVNWSPSVAPVGAGQSARFTIGPGAIAVDTAVAPDSWIIANTGTSNISFGGRGSVAFGTAAGLTHDSATITTIEIAIGGAGAQIRQNSGTLELLNAGNNFTGDITVNGGMLKGAAAGTLGASVGAVTVNGPGSTLDLGGFTHDKAELRLQNGGAIRNGTYRTGSTIHLESGSVSASLTGAGSVEKTTSGTVTLSGSNSYSGATTVTAGTLLAGAANAFSANSATTVFGTLDLGGFDQSIGILDGNGTVTNSGGAAKLTLVRDGTIADFNGAITNGSGTMALVKNGTGILTLGGIGSNYTGGTTINGGVLAAGVAGAFVGNTAYTVNGGMLQLGNFDLVMSSLSGAGGMVQLGTATLTLNQAADTRYDGRLAGTGTFTKTGAGTLLLTGDSSGFAGTTTVKAGKLVVGQGDSGALGGSLLVEAGGVLGGSGTIGGLTMAGGGMLAPGNSIGTLTVNGDLSLGAGSIYAVEIGGSGANDRIEVAGRATLGGAKVEVTALDSEISYRDGQSYTILTAAGGIGGAFDPAVLSRSAFLDASLVQGVNAVDLTIALKGSEPQEPGTPEEPGTPPLFTTVAATANQWQTARALDTLQQSGPSLVLYNKLLVLSAGEARVAFEQLSGEINASVQTGLVEDGRLLRDAVNQRIRAAFEGRGAAALPVMAYGSGGPELAAASTNRFAAWGAAFGSWGKSHGDGNAAGFDRSTGGFIAGFDGFVTETWRVGLVTGYSRSSIEVDERRSSADSDNYHLGLYAGGKWDALSFRSGLTHSWSDVDTNRIVAFPGFSDSLLGDYDAGLTQLFGEVGYDLKAGGVELEPFANLAYAHLKTDGFTERGGAAALAVEGKSNDLAFATLGLRAATDFDLGGTKATARGMIGWRHAFGDTTPFVTQSFAGSQSFAIAGTPLAKDNAVIEAGLDFAVSTAATLGIAYQGKLASGAQDHGVRANLAVRF
jgi:outer membrane autotransporter protein